jgi:hypothetical protein
VSAEMAARRTAAAAALGDFNSESSAFTDNPGTALEPAWSVWALRLAAELGSVLRQLDAETGGAQ